MNIFRQLLDKSWATPGYIPAINDRSVGISPAARTALRFLLAVLTSMFFLFIVGYRMRMAMPDWVPLRDPQLLWLNTGLLLLGSLFMQRARHAASLGHLAGVRNNLTAGGLLTLAFLFGQYSAWLQLQTAGFYAAGNPAAAFFYLLTAVHGLHLIGGLLVWANATRKAWQKIEVARIKLTVDLCTTYWHYLLLVWLVFFALLLTT